MEHAVVKSQPCGGKTLAGGRVRTHELDTGTYWGVVRQRLVWSLGASNTINESLCTMGMEGRAAFRRP